MPNVIHVHPDPRIGPMPVAPAPDTPKVERRIADLWSKQDAISLAKSAPVLRALASNPVPKGKTYE